MTVTGMAEWAKQCEAISELLWYIGNTSITRWKYQVQILAGVSGFFSAVMMKGC